MPSGRRKRTARRARFRGSVRSHGALKVVPVEEAPAAKGEPVRVRHVWGFARRVLSHFLANKGLLLAGAVAYNTLLSMVPLLAIILVFLTRFFERSELISVVSTELELLAPGQAAAVVEEVERFLDLSDVIGWVGLGVLVFFSSIAFKMLEDAMAVIFSRTPTRQKRSFWVSALMPYAFILILGLSLAVLTIFSSLLTTVTSETSFHGVFVDSWLSTILYMVGFVGEVLLFAMIYRVMPVAKVRFKRALVGGLFAAVLWELTRQVLLWYFANLSLVSTIYGSLATVIIVLLSMEIAAVILLLGAQVIAELQRSENLGLRWWEAEAPAPPLRTE